MSFHLLFSTQNKCSLCFNSHVYSFPYSKCSTQNKWSQNPCTFSTSSHQSIYIIKPESCTSIIHSYACIVMHACRKQSNRNKILIAYTWTSRHTILIPILFVRVVHTSSILHSINNHFDLILVPFLSPSPTANALLKINWFSCLSFFLPYIKCSTHNKWSQRQQNRPLGSRTIHLSSSSSL